MGKSNKETVNETELPIKKYADDPDFLEYVEGMDDKKQKTVRQKTVSRRTANTNKKLSALLDSKRIRVSNVYLGIAIVILCIIIDFIVNRFANNLYRSNTILINVCKAILTILAFVSFNISIWSKNAKLNSSVRNATIALAGVFLAELFVFNFASYSVEPKNTVYDSSDLVNYYELKDQTTEYIKFNGDGGFEIPNPPSYTRSITIYQTREKSGATRNYTVDILLTDDGSQYTEQLADSQKLCGYGEKYTFHIHPYGDLNSLKVKINGCRDHLYVYKVVCSNVKPMNIMPERLIIMSLVMLLIVLTKTLNWWNVYFDNKRIIHKVIVWAVIIITASTTAANYEKLFMKNNKYPLESGVETYDAFTQQFDAMEKGLPYLDIPVSESLINAENPYDRSQREHFGVEYRWDYCYHDGHYYCYFGKAPILLLYYPCYYLTGKIPTYGTAIAIFGTFAVLSVAMATYACVTYLVKKVRLLVLLALIPTAVCASYLPFLISDPSMYFVTSVAAIGLVAMAIFWAFFALRSNKMWLRLIGFVLSGVFVGLSAGTRPVTTLSVLILAPLFLSVLRDQNRTLSHRIIDATAFMIPIIVAAVLIMNNNYQAFGSYFEFGASYQLTTNDTTKTFFSLSLLPSALWYEYIQPLAGSKYFPYLEAGTVTTTTYENFKNILPNIGMLNLPFILLGHIFFFEAVKIKKEKLNCVSDFAHKAFYYTCFLLPVAIGFATFTAGGTALRYTADAMIPAVLGCAVVLATIVSEENASKLRANLFFVGSVITVFIMLMLPYGNNISITFCSFPELYEKSQQMLIFWH